MERKDFRRLVRGLSAPIVWISAVTMVILMPFGAQGADRLIVKDGDGATKFVATDQGKVGIGTATPAEAIDTAGGSITVNGTDTSGGVGGGMRKPSLGWTENGRMIMGYGGAGGGNLELYSKGHATRAGEFYFIYGGGTSTGKVKFAHYNGSVWNTRMTILSDGNVGIGTDTPSHPLHMGGGAYTDGATWFNASSREYKENIKELSADTAMEAVKALNPVTFSYKANSEETHVGFIAEDVPELVAARDRKGLSAIDIVAVLTKVVQEQQKEIEALKTDNKRLGGELKEKVAALERQLLLMNRVALIESSR